MTRGSVYNSFALLAVLPLAISLAQNSGCRSGSTESANKSMNSNTTVVTPGQNRDLRGAWGGRSIAMEVTDEGADIEFDCARGRITEKISPAADGKFESKGVFERQRPGPERLGEKNEQPAVYRGSIEEKTMTLTIELTRNKETIGSFTLTQGSSGRIHRCL